MKGLELTVGVWASMETMEKGLDDETGEKAYGEGGGNAEEQHHDYKGWGNFGVNPVNPRYRG